MSTKKTPPKDTDQNAEFASIRSLVIGTRKSKLALIQSEWVAAELQKALPHATITLQHVVTEGDRSQAEGKALPAIGGKGLFTAELEAGIRDRKFDLAVHSLKDLPTENSFGLCIAAITKRESSADLLVFPTATKTKEGSLPLKMGAVVGSSSPRRAAELLRVRPDLKIVSIRGNVDTRLKRVASGEFDATVLAAAGLARLGIATSVNVSQKLTGEYSALEVLPLSDEIMLPAPGQGALGIQARCDDLQLLKVIEQVVGDRNSMIATVAERAVLSELNLGCSTPLGAHATINGDTLTLRARLFTADLNVQTKSKKSITLTKGSENNDAITLGKQVATELRR